jgi:hypothetical protein
MNIKKEERIKGIVDDLLDTLSYEELETELKKIADYHCITLKSLEE